MEPGVSYGYTGHVCHCLVLPKIQRPMSNETIVNHFAHTECCDCQKKYAIIEVLKNAVKCWVAQQEGANIDKRLAKRTLHKVKELEK